MIERLREIAELVVREADRPQDSRLRAAVARASGDRERDLEPALRERLARRLDALPDGAHLARMVREPVALDARDEARLLDESLPAGLRLRA
jgi:hypothetical protein